MRIPRHLLTVVEAIIVTTISSVYHHFELLLGGTGRVSSRAGIVPTVIFTRRWHAQGGVAWCWRYDLAVISD